MTAHHRTVLVTGAAGGIGSAITRALITAGHKVAGVDKNKRGLDQLCEFCRQDNEKSRILPIAADLREEKACVRAVDQTVSHFGEIHAVINNAGIGVSAIRSDAEIKHPTIQELTTETWEKFFAINVLSAIIVTRAALPYIRNNRWGRVINITTSYKTMLRVLPYGATKSALESISAIWAKELEPTGITVNVLVPGGRTDTPLIADESGWPRDTMLRPEIMGPPACWLISNDSDSITGRRITAKYWDAGLSGSEALTRAERAIGWPELIDDAKP